MELKGKNIILTGAGSGIGQQVALELLREGSFVFGLDMSDEGLVATKGLAGADGDRFSPFRLDITKRDEVDKFISDLKENEVAIDGLINNAGIIQPFVVVEDLSWNSIEKVMDVNFYGMLYLTKSLISELKSRKESILVNVSSMGGFLPVPGQAVYGASKAAVKLLTEALYAELKDSGVHVSVVFPGGTDTKIAEHSGIEMDASNKGDYKMTSAEDAAKIIVNGIKKEKFRILIGKDARMMDILYRLSPKKATEMIAKQMKALLNNN